VQHGSPLGTVSASHGHTPKLMAAEFVVPFRKSQGAKNDRNDAQAILTAVRSLTCDLCRSSLSTSKPCWRGTGADRVSSWIEQRCSIECGGCWPSLACGSADSSSVLIGQLPQLSEDPRLPSTFVRSSPVRSNT